MAQQELMDALTGSRLPAWDSLPDFGLYMDQMLSLVERSLPGLSGVPGLTPAMINNYVKAGLIDRPQGKKYSRDALSQLLMIVILKQTLTQENMKALLHPAENTPTREIYEAFLTAQENIAARFQTMEGVSPLTCALESATLSLAFRLMQPEGR